LLDLLGLFLEDVPVRFVGFLIAAESNGAIENKLTSSMFLNFQAAIHMATPMKQLLKMAWR